jgi:hypothetical protein
MSWQLIAEGHSLDEVSEKKLFRLLGKLFSNPDYGAVHPVRFSGEYVSGNPMNPQDLAAAAPPAVEAKAGLVPKGEEYPKVAVESGQPTEEEGFEPEGGESEPEGGESEESEESGSDSEDDDEEESEGE